MKEVRINTNIAVDIGFSVGTAKDSVLIKAYSGNYDFGLTNLSDTNGAANILLEKVWQGFRAGTGTADDFDFPNTVFDRNNIDFYFYRYDLSIASFSLVNVGRKGALNKSISMNSDFDIIESDQSIVESYTELENLDKLYDRAKSWKVSNTNVTFPSKERLLARKNQNQLDFGSLDLIIDNNASYPLSVDKINNVVRVKANTLVAGTKFNSLSTSGTISVEGGANIEVGYKDNTGTHKFIALNEVNNSDILIRDNSTTPPTSIVSITAVTGDYKTHFLAPSDTSKIEVLVSRANHSTFQENYPEKELSFVRTPNLQLTQVVAESQIEMLNLATKILQKEEAFYRALDLTNPTLTVTHTLSNMTGSPSVENQEAILSIMYKVFNKVVANRRKLKN